MTELKIITGCSCGIDHVYHREEADRLLELAKHTEPLEVVQENGARVTVPPLTVVLHGRS
jgi:hypothetical protein